MSHRAPRRARLASVFALRRQSGPGVRAMFKAGRLLRASGRRALGLCAERGDARWAQVRDTSTTVLTSPYGSVDIPRENVAEYVWKNVERWADKPAIVCGVTGETQSFADVRLKSHIFAASLVELGLNPKDVINIIMPNCLQFPVALLGSLEAGLIVTTVNPAYTADEILHQLEETDTKCIVTHRAVLETVLTARSKLGRHVPVICVTGDKGSGPISGVLSEEEFTKNYKPRDTPVNPVIDVNEAALILFSSGTTGLPKGVCLSSTNLVSNMVHNNCRQFSHHQETTKEYQETTPGFLPFFHLFGLKHMLCGLSNGRNLVILPRFDPKYFLNVLEKNREVVIHAVPPVIGFLGSHPAVKPKHLERIRAIVTGGAPTAAADIERVYRIRRFPIVQAYGLTESSPLLTHPPKTCEDISTVGPLIQNTQGKVVDIESGKVDLGVGETGELCFRGPQIMIGYHKNPKATAEAIDKDGWLHTGDIGYYNKDGYFFIVDRKKEMIKVKGFQVAPAEVESALKEHPKVLDAGVTGVPCPRNGEKPVAYVVPRDRGSPPERSEIIDFLSAKLADFKLPADITVIDQIPKTVSGKILRKQLAELYKKEND